MNSSPDLDLEELYLSYGPNNAERVYGKHIEGSRYIIASVPFLSSLYSFCDIVRVRYTNGVNVVDQVLQPSSFRTIRCQGARPQDRDYQHLVQELDRQQCVIAWQLQRDITAIAVPMIRFTEVVKVLQTAESENVIRLLDETKRSLTATA